MIKQKFIIIQMIIITVLTFSLYNSIPAQGNANFSDSTKSFIAVLKITIPDSVKISGKEVYTNLVEKQIESLIKRNSEELSGGASNTVWIMDTIIAGSRFTATVYSGITSRTIRGKIDKNSIFMYSPKNSGEKRAINGIFMYLSEESGYMIESVMDDDIFEKSDPEK
jgi:hypothetical protein